MLQAIAVSAVGLIVPSSCAIWFLPRDLRPAGAVPLTILGALFYFALAGIVHRFVAYTPVTFWAVVLLVTVCLCGYVHWKCEDFAELTPGVADWRSVTFIAGLGMLAVLDVAIILSQQYWGVDGGPTHFHGLQLDPVRNTDVTLALLRGSDTLFLPESQFAYQLFWYQGAAAALAVLAELPSRFPQVMGVTVVTGWLGYVGMLWVVWTMRPGVLRAPVLAVAAVALVLLEGPLTNSDPLMRFVGHFFPSALSADPGDLFAYLRTEPPYFRYMSFKLFALTAPQHLIFVAFFVVMLVARAKLRVIPAYKLPLWAVLCVGAGVASPILFVLIVPFYFALDTLLRRGFFTALRRNAIDVTLVGLAIFVVHIAIVGFSVSDLFLRPGVATFRPIWRDGLLNLPIWQQVISPAAATGIVGVAAMILIPVSYKYWGRLDRNSREFSFLVPLVGAIASGFVFWNFVLSDTEIQRHFSFLTATGLALTGALLVTALPTTVRSVAAVIVVGGGLVTYGSFYVTWQVSNLVTSPSLVSVDVPWYDYVCANQYIRSERPGAGVVAASGDGVIVPVAGEVATTLAPRLAILAHQKITQRDLAFLSLERGGGAFDAADMTPAKLDQFKAEGFNTIVWGPVEERAWGAAGRATLLDGAEPLALCGQVAVFALGSTLVSGAQPRFADVATQANIARVVEELPCEVWTRDRLRDHGFNVVALGGHYRVTGGWDGRNVDVNVDRLTPVWRDLTGEACNSANPPVAPGDRGA
jgi:hypothetical protein